MCAYCDRLSACHVAPPAAALHASFVCSTILLPRFFNFCYIFLLRFSFSRSFFVPSYFIFIVCFCVLAFAACQSLFHSHFASCLEKSNLLSFCQLRLGSSQSGCRAWPCCCSCCCCCWASALCRRVDVPVVLILTVLATFKSYKRLLLLSFYCFLYVFLRCLLLDSFIIGNQ